MPKLPEPGQQVHWRCHRHAHALGWAHAYGPGPFPVVRVVDKSQQALPAGVVVRTLLGEREINEVWLALPRGQEGSRHGAGDWPSYSAEVLEALDAAG
jgi:hypothetical protein